MVGGLGLLTVLLPPYERPWWVAGARDGHLASCVVGVCLVEPAAGRERSLARPGGGLPRCSSFVGRCVARGRAAGPSSGMTVLLFAAHPLAGDHRVAARAVRRERAWPASRSWHPGRGHRAPGYAVERLAPRRHPGSPSPWCSAASCSASSRDLERRDPRAPASPPSGVERLFLDAPHGVAVLDTSGRIQFVNASLCRHRRPDPPDDGRAPADGAFAPPGDDRDRRPPRRLRPRGRHALERLRVRAARLPGQGRPRGAEQPPAAATGADEPRS